jgi:hypothetical protein
MIKVSCIINEGDKPLVFQFEDEVFKAIYHYQKINDTIRSLSNRNLINYSLLNNILPKLKKCEDIFLKYKITQEKFYTYDFENIIKI